MRHVLVRGDDGIFRPSAIAFTDEEADLRDRFALEIVRSDMSKNGWPLNDDYDNYANHVYALTDALLKARLRGTVADPSLPSSEPTHV
jgi:hypothetical protein